MSARSGAVIGMFVGGLASLAVVGWLMQVRMGRPLGGEPGPVGTFGTPEALSSGGELDDAQGLAALAAGGAYTVQVAQRALDERRTSDAARALDAAGRVVRIGMHAAGSAGAPFELAHRLVQQARAELQNGRPETASRVLRDAGPALSSFTASATPPPAGDLTAYDGGTVVDIHGVRIGEIDRFSSPEGEPRQARIRLGGWQDFMGFLDLGGRQVLVPANTLVLGPASPVGETLVAATAR